MVLFCAAAVACGPRSQTRRPRKPPRNVTVNTMETVQIVAGGKGKEAEAFTASELFAAGLKAYWEKQYSKAAVLFERLVKFFPRSPHAPSAHFNRALSLEKAKQFEQAAKLYRSYLKRSLPTKDRLEGIKRLATVLYKARAFRAAARVFEDLAADPHIRTAEQLEATLQQGRSLVRGGALDRAEKVLRGARRLYALARKGTKPPKAAVGARIAFLLAEVISARMKKIQLRLPPEKIGKDLFRKAQLFKKASRRYLAVSHFKAPVWTAAALVGMGQMCEMFFWDVVRAPVPRFDSVRYFDKKSGKWKEISAHRLRADYARKVKRKLRWVLKSALDLYRSAIQRLRYEGMDSHWIEKGATQIRTVKRLLAKLDQLKLGQRNTKEAGSRSAVPKASGSRALEPSSTEEYFPHTVPL
jgi:TolA-binding protein